MYHGISCKKCIVDLGIALDSMKIDKCALVGFHDDFANRRELERMVRKYLPKVEVFFDKKSKESIFKKYYKGKSPTTLLITGDSIKYYNFKDSEFIWKNLKLPKK